MTKIAAKRSIGKSQSNGIAIAAWKWASIHQAAHEKERQRVDIGRRERHSHKRRQSLNMFGIVLAKHFLVNQYVQAIIVMLFRWGQSRDDICVSVSVLIQIRKTP